MDTGYIDGPTLDRDRGTNETGNSMTVNYLSNANPAAVDRAADHIWWPHVTLWLLRLLDHRLSQAPIPSLDPADVRPVADYLALGPVDCGESGGTFDRGAIAARREVQEVVFGHAGGPVHPLVVEMVRELGLSADAAKLLTFAQVCGDNVTMRIVGRLLDVTTEADVCELVALALDMPASTVERLLSPDAQLRRAGLVTISPAVRGQAAMLRLDESLRDWTLGGGGESFRSRFMQRAFVRLPTHGAVFGIDGMERAARLLQSAVRFGGSGIHLLIHGGRDADRWQVGRGLVELVAAAAVGLGPRGLGRGDTPGAETPEADDEAGRGWSRYRRQSALLATGHRPVLVGDGVDGMLGPLPTRQREAERLALMRDAAVPTLWLVDRLDRVDARVREMVACTVDLGSADREEPTRGPAKILAWPKS